MTTEDPYPEIPIDPDLSADDPGEPSADHRPTPSAARRSRAEPAVLAAIAIGGALGTPARYGMTRLLPTAPGSFPWATFWTNVSGSFALGVLMVVLLRRFPTSRLVRPLLGVGFLGAFTTFSTFGLETALLVKDHEVGVAAAYVAASLVVGLGAVWAGMALARNGAR